MFGRPEQVLNEHFAAAVQQQVANLPDETLFRDLLPVTYQTEDWHPPDAVMGWHTFYQMLDKKQKSQLSRLLASLTTALPIDALGEKTDVIYPPNEVRPNTIGVFRHMTINKFETTFSTASRYGLKYNSLEFLAQAGFMKATDGFED